MLRRTSKGMLSHFGGSSMHTRKYTDKTILEMKNKILSGRTYRDVGNDYGVKGATIHRLINRFNPIIKESISIPKGFISLRRWCNLNCIDYNTAVYHCRNKSIYILKKDNRIYVDSNITLDNLKFLSQDKIDKMNELRSKGYNKTNIAKEVGISRVTVRKYLELEIV